MTETWQHLRGKDLSDFSNTGQAQALGVDFAVHLAKFGSEQDYHNFINTSHTPLETCMEMLPAFPSASSSWLVCHLQQSTDYQTHLNTALHILSCMEDLIKEKCDPYALFRHVDFANFPEQQCLLMFKHLIAGGAFEVVRDHWNVYEKVVHDDVGGSVVFAANWGFDLRTLLSWAPVTLCETHSYFTACCRGGLLDRVKEVSIDPSEHSLLRNSFVWSMDKPNAYGVLEYLWNTYPNSLWHKEEAILYRGCKMAHPLRTKIIDYFATERPKFSQKALTIFACDAICESDKDVYNSIFSYISVKNYPKIMCTAIEQRNKSVLNILLKHPKSFKLFNQALSDLATQHHLWALEFFAQVQNKTLVTAIGVGKGDKKTTTSRKM